MRARASSGETPRWRETRAVARFARRTKIKEQRLLEVYFCNPLILNQIRWYVFRGSPINVT